MNSKTQPYIKSLSVQGVHLSWIRPVKFISWADLREAARSTDEEAAPFYETLLARAERRAAESSTVKIDVCRDSTGVWWVARARTVCGEVRPRWWLRPSWAGLTHALQGEAHDEAERLVEAFARQNRTAYIGRRAAAWDAAS